MPTMLDLLAHPAATGRDGIHICAQLRIDGLQLDRHRIGWASATMEKAAGYIEYLEGLLAGPREATATDAPAP